MCIICALHIQVITLVYEYMYVLNTYIHIYNVCEYSGHFFLNLISVNLFSLCTGTSSLK